MKTIYSIGRDPGCDIYLVDDRHLISRNHAILKVGKGGKYFIIDQSMNGTYINGIKISQGVQVPVNRKDIISFAHVAELDWNQIPRSKFMTIQTALIGLIAAGVLVTAGLIGYKYLNKCDSKEDVINSMPAMNEQPNATETDSVDIDDKTEVKEVKKMSPATNTKVTKKNDNTKSANKDAESNNAEEVTETQETIEEVKDTVNYQPYL